MKINFVVFEDDATSNDRELCEINNSEIKFGDKKLVVSRKTLNVDYRAFIGVVLSNKASWKYRMYDMNNRRRNVWLIREKDYKKLVGAK